MEGLRRFANNIFYSYKSVYGWMTLRSYLFLVILVPFSQTALFSYLNYFIKGIEGMQYAALGNAFYSMCVFVVFTLGTSVTIERRQGTLQIILLTPISKVELFLSKSILHIMEGFVTSCFSFLVGKFLFKLDFSQVNWLSLGIFTIITTVMMIGVGFFAGVTGLLFRRATPLLNIIYLLLLLLCGVNFPVERLHFVLQVIARGIPLTYGIRILRNIYSGASIEARDLCLLCVTGIVFFVTSIFVFAMTERFSRRKGSLDIY